jgi:hypothetical protein
MALIFNSNVKLLVAGSICRALQNGTSGSGYIFNGLSYIVCEVSVYSGVQPDAATFAANWASTYNSASSAFLAHFTDSRIGQPSQGNMLQMVQAPTAVTPLRNGTATWAVIWGGSGIAAGIGGSTVPGTRYMIVPASSLLSNSIVRFTDAVLSTATPVAIADITLGINL